MPQSQSRMQVFAYLALVVGIVCISFSAIFVSMANAPGTVVAFYRMAIPTVIFSIPFLINVKRMGSIPKSAIRFAVFGGMLFAIDVSLWATGISISGATNPTLLANTAPLWVGLGALLFFHEKLKPLFWIGLGLAMLGAALVIGQYALQDLTLGLGTILGLGAGIFYGAYFLVTQVGRKNLDALSYFWISVLGATVLLFAINILLGQPLLGYPKETYLSLFALGFISQGVGWLAINFAQGLLPAILVAPTLLAQPIITAFLAGPILGETHDPWQVMGGLWVLAGIYLVHRSRAASKGVDRG